MNIFCSSFILQTIDPIIHVLKHSPEGNPSVLTYCMMAWKPLWSRELDKLEIGFILNPPTAISVYTLSKHDAWIQHNFQVLSSRSTFNTNVSDSRKRYFPWKDENMNPQNDSHNHAWFTCIYPPYDGIVVYRVSYITKGDIARYTVVSQPFVFRKMPLKEDCMPDNSVGMPRPELPCMTYSYLIEGVPCEI